MDGLLYSCSIALDYIRNDLCDIVLYLCCKVITVDHYFQKKGRCGVSKRSTLLIILFSREQRLCLSIHPGRHKHTANIAQCRHRQRAYKPVCIHACEHCACSL